MGKGAVTSLVGQLATFISLIAAATLMFTPHRGIGLLLTVIALVAVGWKAATTSYASTTAATLMLVFGLMSSAVTADLDSRTNLVLAVAGATLMRLVVVQPTVDGLLGRPTLGVRNLPGYRQATLIEPRVPADFEASFPLARAAYVIDEQAGNLPGVLDDLLDLDPIEATRREVRTYYLGDFAEEGYADAFVRTARFYVDQDDVTLITEQPAGVPA